jgi:hypothetical protein
MKRTFAILPIAPDDDDLLNHPGPDRRTIRRTDSGNLRVMRRRGSLDSLRNSQANQYRPYTATSDMSTSKASGGGHRRTMSLTLPKRPKFLTESVSHTFEGLQNLPRKLSERRREKRTQELRAKISGPREVRDGVGDVIRRTSNRELHEQSAI